jgi:hypothetical protein
MHKIKKTSEIIFTCFLHFSQMKSLKIAGDNPTRCQHHAPSIFPNSDEFLLFLPLFNPTPATLEKEGVRRGRLARRWGRRQDSLGALAAMEVAKLGRGGGDDGHGNGGRGEG